MRALNDVVRGFPHPTRGRDGDPGVFGPGSLAWTINRESVLLLGGARALLMQIAHPQVAAGVADHSDFTRNPYDRLWRTVDAALTVIFGDTNSTLAGAHAMMGWIHMSYDWDWQAADREYKQALALDPGRASVLANAATLARALGRIDESIELNRRGISHDPLQGLLYTNLAISLMYAGRLEGCLDFPLLEAVRRVFAYDSMDLATQITTQVTNSKFMYNLTGITLTAQRNGNVKADIKNNQFTQNTKHIWGKPATAGAGPTPMAPFSVWMTTSTPAGTKLAISVGRPMPRLMICPSLSSRAARRAMVSFALPAMSRLPVG